MKLTIKPKYIRIAAHFESDIQLKAACQVVSAQFITGAFASLVLFFLLGIEATQAVFFGGAVAMANTLFLVWCTNIGARRPVPDARQELARMVLLSMERFFLVALLMVAGLVWLKLMPVPFLVGFVLGQITLVVSTIFSRE